MPWKHVDSLPETSGCCDSRTTGLQSGHGASCLSVATDNGGQAARPIRIRQSAIHGEESGETITIAEIIDNIWQNIERDYNARRLVKRLRRVVATMSGNARGDFAIYIPDGNIGKFADELQGRLKSHFTETMTLLRTKGFQDLLLNYERARTPFYVAYGTQDIVTSEQLFTLQEEQLKPADYLTAFSHFIQANKERVESLSILFRNPRKWNTNALREIRHLLKTSHFDESEVQKAHALSGHKALADIISMIKNADNEQNPLLTAEERVNKSIADILESRSFNEAQKEWLEYIREHLVINLAIEQENFDLVPVLERHGGLAKAKKIFGAQLEPLLEAINTNLAA